MAKIIIIRGLPGAGKSTLAMQLVADAHRECKKCTLLEADLFHTMPGGTYEYRRELQGYAHSFCLSTAAFYLNKGMDVVVANTFVNKKECLPYFKMAKLVGAELEIRVCTEQYQNIHGVPDEVIENMTQRWESFTMEDLECYYNENTPPENPGIPAPGPGKPPKDRYKTVSLWKSIWGRFV